MNVFCDTACGTAAVKAPEYSVVTAGDESCAMRNTASRIRAISLKSADSYSQEKE